MSIRKVNLFVRAALALGLFRSKPAFGKDTFATGFDPASGSDEIVLAEVKSGKVKSVKRRILPEGVRPQNIKLNKAEAKRYRKNQKRIRDQARVAAGQVC